MELRKLKEHWTVTEGAYCAQDRSHLCLNSRKSKGLDQMYYTCSVLQLRDLKNRLNLCCFLHNLDSCRFHSTEY